MKTSIQNLSRRGFLKTSANASALILGAYVAPGLMSNSFATTEDKKTVFAPNVYLSINNEGVVSITVHRSEMGQGIRTSLPMIVADELEADWEKINIIQAEGDKKYGSQNTDGSRSVRRFYQPLRAAGATARFLLEQAGAKHWGVPHSECYASQHKIIHKPSGKSLSFAELVEQAATLPLPDSKQLTYKSASAFRYIGKDVRIVDMEAMITGRAQYGIDTQLPGMKYVSIERPPVLFGKVKKLDKKNALAQPGVEQVLVLPTVKPPVKFNALGGVAVIAKNTWAAQQGREKLSIEWEHGENSRYDTQKHNQQMSNTARKPGKIVRAQGKIETAFSEADKVLEAQYHVPLLSHVSMEPPVAVADVKEDFCEIWACVQTPQSARSSVAKALGFSEDQVKVNVTLLGGGFGRKSKPDFAVEAALISQQIKAPAKVTWTREDDIKNSYYHTVSTQYLKGSLDKKGNTTGWLHRTVFPSISSTFDADATYGSSSELGLGFTDNPFSIDHMQLENGHAPAHVRIGWMRSVANIYHAFALGSFADELAHAAKKDPADYLEQLIGEKRNIDLKAMDVEYSNYGDSIEDYPIDTGRLLNVVKMVRSQSGWGRKLPTGHGLGIAVHRSFLSYVATVVEVSVSPSKMLTVEKIWMTTDSGTVINPDRVRSQMEGAAVFGLSLALHGKLTAKEGQIQQSNFHDYPVARINETPDTEVVIVNNKEIPAGVGEPGTPPLAPALCNAIFAASGQRIRELPIGRQLQTTS